MVTQVSIRDFLKRQGITNIGWDNQQKQATVGGQALNVNTTVRDGRSFANRDELMAAINRIRGQQQQTTTGTTPVQTQPQNYQANVSEIIQSLQQRASQQPEPFQYNPYQDPNYQNALQMARRNAELASNRNLAEMNRRGILSSTITSDRGARIQQQELGRVTSEILPQLIDQAYQRYMNEQALRQQQFQNLASLADRMSALDQQAWQNRFAYGQAIGTMPSGQQTLERQRLDLARQAQEFDQQMAREQFEYQQARDAIADERYKQEFDEDVRRFGLQYALDKATREGQLSLSRGQLALSQQRLEDERQQRNLENLYRQWEATGVAPEGIPGIPAGTPYPTQPSSPSATDYQTSPDFAQDVQFVLTNPDQASQLLRENAAEFIRMYGERGYRALLSYLPDEEVDPLQAILGE